MKHIFWKSFDLNIETNSKEKNLFPSNYKNLFKIFFFKKKKSSIFFFKSEKKYKVKINLKINVFFLKELISGNKLIPQKKNLIYFFKYYNIKRKLLNNLEINEQVDFYLNNPVDNNEKTILENINFFNLDENIYLDLVNEKIFFDKPNFNLKKNNTNKIIFNELYLENMNMINGIINKRIKNNLNLLNLYSCNTLLIIPKERELFWKHEFQKNNYNYKFINKNIDDFHNYKILVNYFDNYDFQHEKYHWNNLIVEFPENLKKWNTTIDNIKCKNKIFIINTLHKISNYTQILNYNYKNYDQYIFKNIINTIQLQKYNLDKDLNVKNYKLQLNNLELEKYNSYINKFRDFYYKNNIKFSDDLFLRKMCCFPQKDLKLKILDYKNIDKDIELFDINGEYKNRICNTVNTIKIRLKNDKKNKCNICLSKISKDNFGITKCGHYFCYSCISKSINYKNECPTCRYNISNESLFYVKINKKISYEKKLMEYGLFDDLGTKCKKLITLIKKLKKVVIFTNYTETINSISKILDSLNIKNIKSFDLVDNTDEIVIFLDYNLSYWNNDFYIENINDIILLDPIYENKNLISKYKYILSIFYSKKINIHNLIIKNTIEEETLSIFSNTINSILHKNT